MTNAPLATAARDMMRQHAASLLDSMADASLIVDAHHVIVYCHAGVARLFGYSAGSLIGQPLSMLLPEHVRATHDEHVERFRRGETSTRGHMAALLSGLHADGHHVPLDVTISRCPAWDEQASIAVLRDAADRLEDERMIRDSDERFRRVAQASRDVLYEWDLVSGTRWFGHGLSHYFGHSSAVARDRDWWEAQIHPDDRDRVRASLKAYQATGDALWAEEYRIARADGTYAIVLNRAICERDAAGMIVRSEGALMDVTDLRAAEDAHRRETKSRLALAQRMQLILDHMPSGCLLSDDTGVITYANSAALTLLGFQLGELIGQRVSALFDSDLIGIASTLPCEVETRASWKGVLTLNSHDGRSLIVEWEQTPVLDAVGAGIGCLCLVVDITARRSLEAQLVQAQKMEAIGRLASGVAHDFNNLLSVILNGAELLSESFPVDDPGTVEIHEIQQAAFRGTELTRQLLAFSRREASTPRVVDLNRSIANVERMLQRLIGEHISVTMTPHSAPVSVLMDPLHFEQLLMNLAVNAKDAMPSTGALSIRLSVVNATDVAVGTTGVAPASRFAQCVIQDTGTGIAAEHLPHIFEPFFSTKENGKGTGLGLSICYNIVQQAAGSIAVRSRTGEGTTFEVLLPMSDVEAIDPLSHAAPAVSRGSGTLLLVEDDPTVRSMYEHALGSAGYHVHSADTPEAAHALLDVVHDEIDVLVSDVGLPQMNGYELALELRARRHIPHVLFVTGYLDDLPEMPHEGLADAKTASKPLTGLELAAKVRELFARESDSNHRPP
ncbi:MAG: PAS domain S-box protein [Gemmatimonas sp.]